MLFLLTPQRQHYHPGWAALIPIPLFLWQRLPEEAASCLLPSPPPALAIRLEGHAYLPRGHLVLPRTVYVEVSMHLPVVFRQFDDFYCLVAAQCSFSVGQARLLLTDVY